jgi:hypothetical protein
MSRHGQAVARSGKSFQRVFRNLEFLQINVQGLFKLCNCAVELFDPPLFDLVALWNVNPNRGNDGIRSQNLVIVAQSGVLTSFTERVSLPGTLSYRRMVVCLFRWQTSLLEYRQFVQLSVPFYRL